MADWAIFPGSIPFYVILLASTPLTTASSQTQVIRVSGSPYKWETLVHTIPELIFCDAKCSGCQGYVQTAPWQQMAQCCCLGKLARLQSPGSRAAAMVLLAQIPGGTRNPPVPMMGPYLLNLWMGLSILVKSFASPPGWSDEETLLWGLMVQLWVIYHRNQRQTEGVTGWADGKVHFKYISMEVSLSSFNTWMEVYYGLLWIVMVCYGFHDIGKSEKCRGTQPPFSLQCQVPMEEVPDQELEVTSSKLKPARTEATRPRFGSGSHGSHW